MSTMTSTRRHRLPTLAAPVVLATTASAHERWVEHTLLRPYDGTYFREWTTLGATLAAALVLGLSLLAWLTVTPRVTLHAPRPLLPPGLGPRIVRVATGLGLLLFAYQGAYLAPDLVGNGSLASSFLVALTAGAAFGLVAGWRVPGSSLVLALLFVFAAATRPFEPFKGEPIVLADVLFYFEFLAILAYLFLRTGGLEALRRGTSSLRTSLAGTRVLQYGIGLNVLLHGLMKIARPDLPMGVVQNNAEALYEPFASHVPLSQEGFVLCAAAMETALGTMVLFGLFPSLALIVLSVFVVCTALVFRGELLGHLPRVSGVLALLLTDCASVDRRAELPRLAGRHLARLFTSSGEPDGRGASVGRQVAATAILLLIPGAAVGLLRPDAAPGDAPLATAGVAAGAEDDDGFVAPPEDEPWTLVAPGATTSALGSREAVRFHLEPFEPVVVGQLFSLHVALSDAASGEPLDLEGVRIHVVMPRHGHGMPTLATMRELGEGRYVLEGCQLNMYGLWTIHVVAGERDEAVFELRYAPGEAG